MFVHTIKNAKPIKIWQSSYEAIDEKCREQAEHLSKLPFAYKWISLMPDTHAGKGMPIGGVIACDGVVIPNAVGVDIGCGMAFVQTDIPVSLLRDTITGSGNLVQAICGDILRNIPTVHPDFSLCPDGPDSTVHYGLPECQALIRLFLLHP